MWEIFNVENIIYRSSVGLECLVAFNQCIDLHEISMKLPNIEKAVVQKRKIVDYLLSEASEEGSSKAAFFARFGFSVAEWERLADALQVHAVENDVTRVLSSRHGNKYIVEGPLAAPDGREPFVRVVWIIEKGDDQPRLVTAYPMARKSDD
jgi:hypothetical protein